VRIACDSRIDTISTRLTHPQTDARRESLGTDSLLAARFLVRASPIEPDRWKIFLRATRRGREAVYRIIASCNGAVAARRAITARLREHHGSACGTGVSSLTRKS
jgi:hypothetical protein